MRDLLIQRATLELRKLDALLPFAIATGQLASWSQLYAEGYLLKLRMTR